MERNTTQTNQVSSYLTVDDLQRATAYLHDYITNGYKLIGKLIEPTKALFVLRHRRNGARLKLSLYHRKIEIYRKNNLRKTEKF